MSAIRRFGPATHQPIPRPGTRGLSGTVIQLPAAQVAQFAAEDIAKRYGGTPFLLDQATSVISLSLAPHGEIDEHDAPFPILFIVIGGSGFVRVGGPDAVSQAISSGDAILWPANVLHTAWTEDDSLHAISIEYPSVS